MNDPRVLTPEVVAQLVELLPTVESIQDLGRLTGLNPRLISRKLAPFIAIMRLQGALSPCGCGRERFHPGGCVRNVKKRDCPFPGHRREDWSRLETERAMIVAMLVAGERLVDIEAALGLSAGRAVRCAKCLNAEQRAAREAAVAARKRPRPSLRLVHSGEPSTSIDLQPNLRRVA